MGLADALKSILTGLMVLTLWGCTDNTKEPIVEHLTASDSHLLRMAQRHGAPMPWQLVQAVRSTSHPRLMMAIAIVESGGRPWARGSAGECGAWQVIPAFWGEVPDTLDGQARHAETVLEELLRQERGSVRRALCRYNGDRTGRYARRVLAVLKSGGQP